MKTVNHDKNLSIHLKDSLRRIIKTSDIGDAIWFYLHLGNILILKLLPDEKYFERAFYRTHGEKPDFDNPRTFDEKQLWLKMHYRNPLCTKCSDKYLVRDYVAEQGYGWILNKLYGVYNHVEDIEWEKLPDSFYLKANHASGCNVRCDSQATLDKNAAIKRLKRGMHHDSSMDSREWNYHGIQRKIIAEAIIESKTGAPLVDYRFLCSAGKCEYLFIDIGTADKDGKHLSGAKRNVYNRDMNLLDVKVTRERFDPSLVQKPANFEEMRECAERLSRPFPFCRVDLYNNDGAIIFGEMTFFHTGGLSKITPKEWEYKLGEPISLEYAQWQIDHNYDVRESNKIND